MTSPTASIEAALAPVEVLSQPSQRHLRASRQFQGIPGIEVTPRGRLWATWYSGGTNEGLHNFVLLITSTDNGANWSEPVAIIDPPTPNVRAYDPALWIDPQGRLWIFWAQCWSEREGHIYDGVGGVWGAYTSDLECDHPSWSTPVRLANGIMMNKPTVLKSGAWALPTALWSLKDKVSPPAALRGEAFSNMVISRDQGATFELLGGADIPDRHFDEHMIVEKRDGTLWMLVRTYYGIGQSFSTDGGRTWSAGEDSKLGGPDSRFFIRRLPSGNLLLINHAMAKIDVNQASRRQMLSAWISTDDGASWQGELLLDERSHVSYPDGAIAADGTIWIIYDHDRYGAGDILLARFREEDVLAGRMVTPGSCSKLLVDYTGGVPGHPRRKGYVA